MYCNLFKLNKLGADSQFNVVCRKSVWFWVIMAGRSNDKKQRPGNRNILVPNRDTNNAALRMKTEFISIAK